MKCPCCAEKQRCPCKNCADKNKGEIVWIWVDESCKCGKCGFTMHADGWLDLEWQEITEDQP
jgi:hypothetical protein